MNLIRIPNPHEQSHPWDNERIHDLAVKRVRLNTTHMDIEDEDIADLIGCESDDGAHALLDKIRTLHLLKMQQWEASSHPTMLAEAEQIVREERDEYESYIAESREAA